MVVAAVRLPVVTTRCAERGSNLQETKTTVVAEDFHFQTTGTKGSHFQTIGTEGSHFQTSGTEPVYLCV